MIRLCRRGRSRRRDADGDAVKTGGARVSTVTRLQSTKTTEGWLSVCARKSRRDGDQKGEEGLTGATRTSSKRRRRSPTPANDFEEERARW